jgi:hypothetical protein
MYMGNVMTALANASVVALADIFDGSDASIATLGATIANGAMVGTDGTPSDSVSNAGGVLTGLLTRGLYAFAISQIWPQSGNYAFVLDSGSACGTVDPLPAYMSSDTMHKTWACYQGKLYYLVYPAAASSTACSPNCEGETCSPGCGNSFFSPPPGIDNLDGTKYAGVTISDLISGSVSTYVHNGNANGGGAADPSDPATFSQLISGDITTPGFLTLPVCSADVAYNGWSTVSDKTTPNWPCVAPPPPDDCGDSTFVDTTTSASPLASDCMGIVNNIKGTQGEWTTPTALRQTRDIATFGTCRFTVWASDTTLNVNFKVGAEDVVDIIKDAITRFGEGNKGHIGATGVMPCNGDTFQKQGVQWSIH